MQCYGSADNASRLQQLRVDEGRHMINCSSLYTQCFRSAENLSFKSCLHIFDV